VKKGFNLLVRCETILLSVFVRWGGRGRRRDAIIVRFARTRLTVYMNVIHSVSISSFVGTRSHGERRGEMEKEGT
jgi:hypothetical protein